MEEPHASKELVDQLLRLQRLYDALWLVSRAVIQSKSQEELFQEVCRIIVEIGHFRMAWIGLHDPATHEIVPVAQSGDQFGYLTSTRFSGDESVEGLGPTGTTFRTLKTVVTNDFMGSPTTALWHDQARVSGIQSSVTLPIFREGQPVGVLNVYAPVIGYFQAKELNLLEQSAADISYALEQFEAEQRRSKAELETQRLAAIVRSATDAIVSISAENTFMTWNAAAEALFGYSAEEVIGKSVDLYVPEGRRGQYSQWAQDLRLGKAVGEIETTRLHRDGYEVRVRLVGGPIFDSKGVYLGSLATMRDRSEQNQYTREFDRFFSSWLDILCIANTEGYFEKVSDSFPETVGWSREELTAKPFLEFVVDEDREATIREVDNLFRQGLQTLHFENRYRHKDGSFRILSWKAVALPNRKVYASAHDITELRKAEIEIKELNRALESRAKQLELAKAGADKANRTKSEFLSRMSHELRTPLNATMGFAQLLSLGTDDPKQLECADAILAAGRHLLDLINEILDISRIESGRLECKIEPLPVDQIIDESIDLIHPSAVERGIELTVRNHSTKRLVLADSKRVLQVMLNLLSNAVKFNRPNGTIEIDCHEGESGLCSVEIKDSGFGLDGDSESWLFKPFERGPNPTTPGTGLGLALSLSLANLMGGNLFLKESSPRGSTFVLELALADARSSILPSGTRTEVNLFPTMNNPTDIVYIEDNLANLRLMEYFFAGQEGIVLRSARTAEAGLQAILEQKTDLILLDLHLPDRSGLDVLQELSDNPKTQSIPVLIVSADATDAVIQLALKSGAQGYISKPVDFAYLASEMSRVVSERITREPFI